MVLEQEHLESLYRRYFAMIVAKCSRMLGDSMEAQDVAQETLLRLWEHVADRVHPEATLSWIYRTSTRLVLDRLRKRKTRMGYEADGAALRLCSQLTPERMVLGREVMCRLMDVPERELEAVVLSRVDGLTQAQIAEV
ncbi:MAG: RNA polymerase sigma factor, partial [Myxococcota bacterium]